ncbi:hypothetical protein ACFYTS_18405 [Nocardia sp. NPDC004151]|uniref:hypothetical protein n=1 Tax=Nocardia sp. NPDC004151 TaxID=3364304 RepID=UPI0036850C6F
MLASRFEAWNGGAGLLVDRTDHPTTALWCSAAFTAAAVGVAVIGRRPRATSPVEDQRCARSRI